MKPIYKILTVTLASSLLVVLAGAQAQGAPPDWTSECTSPTNTAPQSIPYVVNEVSNPLMECTMGASGTYTYGSGTGPCFGTQAQSVPNAGKFCFSYGFYPLIAAAFGEPSGVGSIQQYSANFKDQNLALNWGAPDHPGYCYANLVIDGVSQYFGGSNINFFRGFSNRYMFFSEIDGQFTTRLQVELVADAVRFRWNETNNDVNTHQIGLNFGSAVNMLTDEEGTLFPNTGYVSPQEIANGAVPPDACGVPSNFSYGTNFGRVFKGIDPNVPETQGVYIYLSNNQRPPDTDVSYNRTLDPATFPDWVDFVFGETDAFGMHMELTPSANTTDVPANMPQKAFGLTLGKALFVLDALTAGAPTFPGALLPDTGFLQDPGFIINYNSVTAQPGQSVQLLNYVRSTWGNGSYSLPYGVVVDAPKVVGVNTTNFDGTPNPTGLVPNPMNIRVWVDNVGGYAFDQKEFPLQDVRIQLSFQAPGMTFMPGSAPTQVIANIGPRDIGKVDYQVEADNTVTGEMPYTVTVDSQPGSVHKVITGTIMFGARPQLTLYPGANLVAAPEQFVDSAWSTILSNFTQDANGNPNGASVQTYAWDPNQQGYVLSQADDRGRPVWAIYNTPTNQPALKPFAGGPSTPSGFNDTTQLQELSQGWNLIANPFQYPMPIAQINGVSAGSNQNAYTWQQLVSLGFVANFMASYDPVAGKYVYVDGSDGSMAPNTGYWIDVLVGTSLTLSYPPLYVENVPQTSRKVANVSGANMQWRIGLDARTATAIDSQNYVGVVSTKPDVLKADVYKAPMAPNETLQMGVITTVNGRKQFMKQAAQTPGVSYQWPLAVQVTKQGPVTIDWQSVASVPSKFSVRLIDDQTGAIVDMRKRTSYAFTALAAGQRTFKLVVKPASLLVGSVSAQFFMNGNVPLESINYTLMSATSTTVTIQDMSGHLVAELHGNRADQRGPNREVWNLRNSSGQFVTPGAYKVVVKAVDAVGDVDEKSAQFTLQ